MSISHMAVSGYGTKGTAPNTYITCLPMMSTNNGRDLLLANKPRIVR